MSGRRRSRPRTMSLLKFSSLSRRTIPPSRSPPSLKAISQLGQVTLPVLETLPDLIRLLLPARQVLPHFLPVSQVIGDGAVDVGQRCGRVALNDRLGGCAVL